MTAEGDAWFQGSRVRLDFNAEAAAQLRDALDRLARSEPSSGAALARLDVRLPDGRPLRLAVRLTGTDTRRNPDGTYRSSEGVAYVDVSGDFDTHVAARHVMDTATRPYLEVPASEQAAAELDAARVDRALDGRAPTAKVLDDQARDVVRARAHGAADQTRTQRIADVIPSQPGSRDRLGPMTGHERSGRGRSSRRAGGPPVVLVGLRIVAFQGNARVCSARRLVAPRWIWRSSSRCVGAGGC